VKAVAACNEIAKDLRSFAIVVKSYLWCCGIEVVNGDTLGFKENLSLCAQPCRDEVFHNFLLGIDGDTAPRQGFEIDAMPLLSEANFHAIMDQPFPFHSLTNTHFYQKVDGALLQDAGSHPLLAVLPTTSFDDDRVNALSVQEMRQDQPCGSSSHNPNLRAYSHCFFRCDF
jgi:hypothetical protein